jgi:hypothetical protein
VMGIQSSALILKSILTGVMIVLQALMLMCGKVTHKHLKDSAPAIP